MAGRSKTAVTVVVPNVSIRLKVQRTIRAIAELSVNGAGCSRCQ